MSGGGRIVRRRLRTPQYTLFLPYPYTTPTRFRSLYISYPSPVQNSSLTSINKIFICSFLFIYFAFFSLPLLIPPSYHYFVDILYRRFCKNIDSTYIWYIYFTYRISLYCCVPIGLLLLKIYSISGICDYNRFLVIVPPNFDKAIIVNIII